MSRPFTIKPAAETVELDRERGAEVVFTVSNASGRPIHARGRISVTDPAQRAWFRLQDEPERKLKVDETTQYKVRIAVPANGAPGSYKLQFDVVEVDNEESFTEGSPVGFQVKPASAPTPKKFPWWIVAAAAGVLLLGGGGFLVWKLMQPSAPAPVAMADLVGKDLDEARTWVADTGLKLSLQPEFRDPNKTNRVLSQQPAAGEPVIEGETIVALVYEPPLRRVPDLKGKPAAVATTMLQELGLIASVTQLIQDPTKAGTVISQDPTGGQLTQEGNTVNLVAEKGLIQMPDLTRKPEKEAVKILADINLKNVKVLPPELFPAAFDAAAGTIGFQNQPPGTPVTENVQILLTPIGRAVVVPTLKAGMKFDDAARVLAAATLKAVANPETPSEEDKKAGRENVVKYTVPKPGERALAESPVAVVIVGSDRRHVFPIKDVKALEHLTVDPKAVPRSSKIPFSKGGQ